MLARSDVGHSGDALHWEGAGHSEAARPLPGQSLSGVAAAPLLPGQPRVWAGRHPGSQPPHADRPQEVLHTADNDR